MIIGPIFHQSRYETRYGLEKMMSVFDIVKALSDDRIPVEQIGNFDEIAKRVSDEAEEGDVIVVMSSGAFGGVHEKILDALQA